MKEVISFLIKLAENDDLRKRDDLRDFYGIEDVFSVSYSNRSSLSGTANWYQLFVAVYAPLHVKLLSGWKNKMSVLCKTNIVSVFFNELTQLLVSLQMGFLFLVCSRFIVRGLF
jgi:hypothetical protein